MAAAATAVACGGVAVGPPREPAAPRPDLPPLPPIDDATYERRRARAREMTRAAGASWLFVESGTTTFAYLAGGRMDRSERLIALLLPVEGEATIVAPAFEVDRVRTETRVRDVRGWQENASPHALVRDIMAAARAPLAVLVEPHVEHGVVAAIARVLGPEARIVDGAEALARLRVVKEEAELVRMRRAIALTHDAFDVAFAHLEPGMRDIDVARSIGDDFRERGAHGYALVQFGALSALPHGRPRGAALARDTVVLIDGGCEIDGYWSDITRTRFFGDAPPPDFRRVYDVVHDAQSAAIAAVRPGVAAQEIDRAARRVIDRAGFGPYFTHRLGHGLGMDGHEPTYMVEGNTEPLEAGCVFTVEPGIYLPGRFGVRLEDDVECTPNGALLLSRR
jgi:Xaa-Pro dipeptidase